jgi:hypothetical protein
MRIPVTIFAAIVVMVLASLLPHGVAEEDRGRAGLFDTHDTCALCHDETRRGSAMQDAAGRNVAPVDLWRSSMMANAARDPLWRLVVAIETAATPSRKAEIEALCLRCHAPMSKTPGRRSDLDGEGAASALATDGVSCTVCHGIRAEGLGEPSSFSGGWQIGKDGRLFGPHADPFDRPMRNHTDFVPVPSDHVLESALCGSCHTLLTRALAPDGKETEATLPEQTPYLEWRNSIYSTERESPSAEAASCQDCHLPKTDLDDKPIKTRIAHNPGGRDFPPTRARKPFGRHVLVGGNALVPRLLREGDRLPREAFDATLERVEEQLNAAATISLERLERTDDAVLVDVRVENLTGHRLPTAHPTRRVWMALEVRDAEGQVVFTSGAFDEQGRIVGKKGSPLPSETAGGPLAGHTDVVQSPDEVVIYEARMEDGDGKPTWLLTRGARFAKDNRLLPRGWRADGPHADMTRATGIDGDKDFGAGSDVVHYRVPLGGGTDAAFTLHLRLLHQTLGTRWAEELKAQDVPAAALLGALLSRADMRPSLITRLDVEVHPVD